MTEDQVRDAINRKALVRNEETGESGVLLDIDTEPDGTVVAGFKSTRALGTFTTYVSIDELYEV